VNAAIIPRSGGGPAADDRARPGDVLKQLRWPEHRARGVLDLLRGCPALAIAFGVAGIDAARKVFRSEEDASRSPKNDVEHI
jgi:hypothetical protein